MTEERIKAEPVGKAPSCDKVPPNIRCLLSTGLGRLHLTQSAEALARQGVDMEVVQGWVPRLLSDGVINRLGCLIGSRHLAAGMKKRQLPLLGNKNHGCALSEFLVQGLFLLNRAGLLSRGQAAKLGWASFGRCSARYMSGQDIFHVRSGAGRGGAIARARRCGLKVVVDHSIAHPTFMESALKEEYARIGQPLPITPDDPFWKTIVADCEDADRLLVNSGFVKETFMEQGFPEDRIDVAYLGVREDFFGLKEEYACSDRIELLFTGGFGLRKGAQYLIPALEMMSDARFRLTVVGTYDEAKPIIDASCVKDSINCTGFIPQDSLKRYLAKSDIYVFPSLAEGCASSGMEAMAAGLPVIATRESGLPIKNGENGWLIPSKSTEALADAIKMLAEDQALRERLGRAAAQTIANNHTWKHYARNVCDIYTRSLGREP